MDQDLLFTFFLTFIPLFVAIDPVGTLPLFIALTKQFPGYERRRLAIQSFFTALAIGIAFAVGGRIVFRLLGITPADFSIAGGLLLVILSVNEIFGGTARKADGDTIDRFVGIVPLGIPLVAGPAMITTLLILQDQYAVGFVILSLFLNLSITLVVFLNASRIVGWCGEATSMVISKVVAIFLAAIGVMMIRKGILSLVTELDVTAIPT